MAENDTVETVEFPTTWDGLKAFDERLYDMPDMVQAEDFTPAQTAMYTVTSGRLYERTNRLNELGWFDGGESRKKRRNAESEIVLALAEYVEYADQWFESLAIDKDAYHEWVKGRVLIDLFAMYVTLDRFYTERLGKSNTSKMHSESAE
ncbi:hypothetical protein [Bifidobacterium moukalabense]|uniref:hypothetical protein n=1 Tax=Bifidobacterium moukalabense TaxID=1333651 RepID=UPI00201D9514|nr:hypothetical protein [Bifidobacterium moukalabense]